MYLAALGVVYGDIGTSPLYALKSCFSIGGLRVSEFNVLGLCSLIIWALLIVVSLKYVNIVMFIDNKGEGGIMALAARCGRYRWGRYRFVPLIMGIIGTALFFGDGIITPAISVMGALEGLHLVSSATSAYVLPLALIVLAILFYFQSRGSGKIGLAFGYVMLLWFLMLAVAGIYGIWASPEIFKALNPAHAFSFLIKHKLTGLLVFGASILVVTGAEALYADMGHFGRKPIQSMWDFLVLPSLLLNYLGQGALLLHDAAHLENPFYHLIPPWGLYPAIALATLATIIASQAVVSGIFSLASQAVMLEYLPRMRIVHTSHTHMGQVYVPFMNSLLCFLTMLAVIQFRTSENLAAAYGLSVAGIMLITTYFLIVFAHKEWKWPLWKAVVAFSVFLMIDCIYFVGNVMKFADGAWYTVLISAVFGYIIYLWKTVGKSMGHYHDHLYSNHKPFLKNYERNHHTRLPGVGIFLSRNPKKTPSSLRLHLQYNTYLFEKTIMLSMITKDVAKIKAANRLYVSEVAPSVYQVSAYYGFTELPNVSKIIKMLQDRKILKVHEDYHCILSRRVLVGTRRAITGGLGEKLFLVLSKNVPAPQDFFHMPQSRVIEIVTRFGI